MRVRWLGYSCLVIVAVLACPVSAQEPPSENPGQPGFLVIEGAADSSGTYEYSTGLENDQCSLSWDQGKLTFPASLPLENWGPFDLGVAFAAEMTGSGASGRLILRDGIYPVTEAITLTDGQMLLEVSSGELEIRGARITYRRRGTGNADFKSGLLLMAGMTLLVIVLLRRARLKASERTGN